MARLIQPNGEVTQVEPDSEDGSFTPDRLRELVGGWVEVLPTKTGHYLVCDEEGKLKGQQYNPLASLLGRPHEMVGNVLVCTGKELGE